MRNYNTFGAWTSHRHTWIQKTHHDSNLKEATTFLLIVFFVISHKGYIQMSFCLRTPKLWIPKLPKLGLSAFWKAITSCADLWLRWGLKQSCSFRQEIFNDMWHDTFKHLFQGHSWLLMAWSQINILTPDLSFGHSLCFKYSNGSCEPFETSLFFLQFNNIKNFLIQWILTLNIPLWKLGIP